MAVNVAIDTNAYSGNIMGDPIMRNWFTEQHHLLVPLIVIAELRAGFAYGSKRRINEALLDEFLSSPYSDILHISEQTTKIYAEIFADLRRKGRPINTNDMWIAALCIEHDVPLLTKDNDFKHIQGLRLALLPD